MRTRVAKAVAKARRWAFFMPCSGQPFLGATDRAESELDRAPCPRPLAQRLPHPGHQIAIVPLVAPVEIIEGKAAAASETLGEVKPAEAVDEDASYRHLPVEVGAVGKACRPYVADELAFRDPVAR